MFRGDKGGDEGGCLEETREEMRGGCLEETRCLIWLSQRMWGDDVIFGTSCEGLCYCPVWFG